MKTCILRWKKRKLLMLTYPGTHTPPRTQISPRGKGLSVEKYYRNKSWIRPRTKRNGNGSWLESNGRFMRGTYFHIRHIHQLELYSHLRWTHRPRRHCVFLQTPCRRPCILSLFPLTRKVSQLWISLSWALNKQTDRTIAFNDISDEGNLEKLENLRCYGRTPTCNQLHAPA